MATKQIYNHNDYVFSESSKRQLATCHPDIQKVCTVALKLGIIDFSVKEGHRSNARQLALQKAGKSQVGPGGSTHNTEPSWAIDLAPYIPRRAATWHDFCRLAGVIQSVGVLLGVPIRWGGDWDQDGEAITDQGFDDGYHFELTEVKEGTLPFVKIILE